MASRGKKKTTMAKLTRESRLRERRLEKQAKKDRREHTPMTAEPTWLPTDTASSWPDDPEPVEGETSSAS
jgi:hypothetical protein